MFRLQRSPNARILYFKIHRDLTAKFRTATRPQLQTVTTSYWNIDPPQRPHSVDPTKRTPFARFRSPQIPGSFYSRSPKIEWIFTFLTVLSLALRFSRPQRLRPTTTSRGPLIATCALPREILFLLHTLSLLSPAPLLSPQTPLSLSPLLVPPHNERFEFFEIASNSFYPETIFECNY